MFLSIILMVKYMLKNSNIYKSNDILDDSFKNKMNSFFNPYEYNFESNIKNEVNMDINLLKTKSHIDRKQTKK